MEIITLRPHQIRTASEVLAASFFDYPMFTFYFPDKSRRARYLPWYFQRILNVAQHYGEIYVTADLSGVIFTLPPTHNKISLWEYAQNGFCLTPFILGLRNYTRSMKCEAFVHQTREKIMKDRQHYYLWGVAVGPHTKRTGVGSRLLNFIFEKASKEKMPIYLETHDEKNVPYYQKHNFDLMKSAHIPEYDLPFWCMVREVK